MEIQVSLQKKKKIFSKNFTNLFSVFLSNWDLNFSEITPGTQKLDSSPTEITYTSPLLSYRSYRLNSSFEKSNIDIDSSFFNNFLNPHKIICNYDLTGICSNTTCKYQHITRPSPSQCYLDLLAYCPTMLKTADDVPVLPNDPMDVKLAVRWPILLGHLSPNYFYHRQQKQLWSDW